MFIFIFYFQLFFNIWHQSNKLSLKFKESDLLKLKVIKQERRSVVVISSLASVSCCWSFAASSGHRRNCTCVFKYPQHSAAFIHGFVSCEIQQWFDAIIHCTHSCWDDYMRKWSHSSGLSHNAPLFSRLLQDTECLEKNELNSSELTVILQNCIKSVTSVFTFATFLRSKDV